jgi:hypothetical protein
MDICLFAASAPIIRALYTTVMLWSEMSPPPLPFPTSLTEPGFWLFYFMVRTFHYFDLKSLLGKLTSIIRRVSMC